MGYRIEYRPVKKIRSRGLLYSKMLILTGCFFFLFLLYSYAFRTQAWNLLQEALIPGDNAVTVAALEQLCAQLRAREAFIPAFRSFCRQILQGQPL